MKAMGDKIESKQIAMDAKVNTIPGYQGVIKDEVFAGVDTGCNVLSLICICLNRRMQ
jgi:acetyl/propionyl-CoA carboxylase alpha subunit